MLELIVIIAISAVFISIIAQGRASTPRPPTYMLVRTEVEDEASGVVLRTIIVVMVLIIIGGLAMM